MQIYHYLITLHMRFLSIISVFHSFIFKKRMQNSTTLISKVMVHSLSSILPCICQKGNQVFSHKRSLIFYDLFGHLNNWHFELTSQNEISTFQKHKSNLRIILSEGCCISLSLARQRRCRNVVKLSSIRSGSTRLDSISCGRQRIR